MTTKSKLHTSRCSRVAVSGLIGLFLALAAADAFAQRAAISVAPTRLEFDERTRSAELDVVNRGTETRVFRLSLAHLKMTEDGRLVEASSDDVKPADPYVRFSPRQVTLAPGKVQKVRVMARVPSDAPDGEYRSHLHFQAVPKAEKRSMKPASRVSLSLEVVGAVSIPLIVRNGELDASASVTDASLGTADGGGWELDLALRRDGRRSTYGDIEVYYITPGEPTATRIGLVKGVAVYPPNRRRTLGVRLQKESYMDLTRGRLVITYRRPADEGGGLLARSIVNLGE